MKKETRRNIGSASGTQRAFFVEVRGVLSEPFQHPNGFTVTSEWRRVPIHINRCDVHSRNFHSGLVGDIPVRNFSALSGGIEDHLNLLDFDSAYTLACLVQTQSDSWSGKSVVCRLVEVEVKYSWSAKTIGASQEISLFHLRQAIKSELFENDEDKND